MLDYQDGVQELFYEAFQTGTIKMARKPYDVSDTTTTNFGILPSKIKQALTDLPEITVNEAIFGGGPNMGFFSQMPIDCEKNQFYILLTDSTVFFVDNQGYDYARYVTELTNITFNENE